MPLYTPPTPSPAPPTRPWPTPTPWPTPPTRPCPTPTPWPKPPTTPWLTPPTRPCPTRPEETTPTVLTLLEPTPWVVLGWSATAATGDPKAFDSQGSNIVGHKMILSLVSSVLFASLALGAPGASNYGGAAVVGPAKQIASPSIQCRTEYVTLWDTEYQEKEEQICETVYEKQCSTRTQRLCQPTTRQECHTEYEQQCSTIYKNVCVQKFRTEYEPYTESECTTEYKQDCQYEWRGQGNDKVWAPIEGTCQNVPYDECKEVAKTHAKQVAYQECNDVQSRSVSQFPSRSASPFLTKCAPTSHSRNARTFLANPATWSTRGSR